MGFAVFFDDDAATFEDDDIQLLLDYCNRYLLFIELV
jgi:hypothetical protein